jgi:hypothetical protein
MPFAFGATQFRSYQIVFNTLCVSWIIQQQSVAALSKGIQNVAKKCPIL